MESEKLAVNSSIDKLDSLNVFYTPITDQYALIRFNHKVTEEEILED